MAIKDSDGNKVTPKEKAREAIMRALADARGYWPERENGMTEREIAAVNEQLKKEADRIAVRFGYPGSWMN